MKINTYPVFSLLFSSLFALSSAKAVPHGAVEKIGFSKRADWIGGASLYATDCPSGTQNCGSTSAQRWCCPKDTVCKSDYCCPNTGDCSTVVRSFPSCADPSWILVTYDYYSKPYYFCCKPGEQGFLAVGSVPACGPGDLQVQSTQKLSTVSPMLTASISVVPSVSTGSQQSSSTSPSSYSSTVPFSDSGSSQVAPSITRTSGNGIPTSGSTITSAALGNSQETSGSGSGGNSNSNSGSTSESTELGGGAIAGIVIGSICGLALICLVGVFGARYGSKKAIERINAAAAAANMANTTPPAPYSHENPSVVKPEVNNHAHEVPYNGPPGEHAELWADSNRH